MRPEYNFDYSKTERGKYVGEKPMKKFTVFFDQINRTNFQVLADNEQEAKAKATNLYKNRLIISPLQVRDGWILESDGEDK